ncbi:flavin reductase family protein [Microbacterium immunditiarum]|uniref:Flavin reductase (DIM6/NTAB) family NADH-FMN oxidoreductase RutF n=1 Tax=Microbacterium immunditiarum TaxID=337480 RepID=A0A7Y9GP00_9MICO|nr:flavin reductase family protein [Microbacterium immunditiarum]NYE19872.1 flavin reductase (DIM6/NTAB) family NADH-FMN oxidoreductase RutF [Microbacterium immunditiarum]
MTSAQPAARPASDFGASVPAHGPGASLSAATFKELFRGHPSGVAVITASGDDGPVALTASSVASVSVDPPLLIFSISAMSSATPAIAAADTIVVHLLDADDLDLARLGATSGVDRFADRDAWAPLPTGEPVYRDVRAWVRCAVVSRMDAGDSTIIAAQGLQATIAREAAPGEPGDALVYHNRTWHRLGEHSRIA